MYSKVSLLWTNGKGAEAPVADVRYNFTEEHHIGYAASTLGAIM
jgi:hypothetical protein